jgi:hypothetical protein
MTEEQQQSIKAQLTQLGLWGIDEPGDPTRNHQSAGTLNERLQAKLAKQTFMVSRMVSDHSSVREVVIFHERETYTLVAAAISYPEAMTLAALALPEFLRQHPECAAQQD